MAEGPPQNSSLLAEGLAAAGLSALFFWGLRFLPFFGAVAIPAAALPLVRFACRRGLKPLLTPLFLVAILSGAMAFSLARIEPAAVSGGSPAPASPGREAAVEILVYLGTVGACAVAGALSRDRDASAVFVGLAVYGAIVVAATLLAVPGAGRDLLAGYDSMAQSRITDLRQAGSDAETLRSWQALFQSGRALAAEFAPGLLTIFWIFAAAPSFFLGRRLAAMPDSFSDFRVPPVLAALFVLSGGAAVVFHGPPRRAAVDVLAPLVVLYFLSGLSIITHFARRLFRFRPLRAMVYVAASVAPFSAVTAGLGLFDWYFDFRRRADRKEKRT